MTNIWCYQGCSEHLHGEFKDLDWVPQGPDFEERTSAVAVFAGEEPYGPAELDAMPDLLMIARLGRDTRNIDLAACNERGILVANNPDGSTTSVAEHALAFILAIPHQIPMASEHLRRADADSIDEYRDLQWSMELKGSTLGIVGCGRIGTRVRQMASALEMRTLVNDPTHPDSVPLDFLLSESDVVTLHVPETPETEHLIDGEALAKMRPGSVLVNCAGGSIVDTDALAEALFSGHLMGAGLDVTDPEPLPFDHPLLQLDNVLVTPHVGNSTVMGKKRTERLAVRQVTAALSGESPRELCNPEALKHPRWSQQFSPA